MRHFWFFFALLSTVYSSSSGAQSTAAPVLPGYLSLQGCSPGQTICFIQFGSGFNASGQANLSATISSSRVALPAGAQTVVVSNAGPSTAFVKLGGSTVIAATIDTPVLVGYPVVLQAGTNVFIAGITASSTAALTITTGTGIPAPPPAGGGSTATITNLPNPADTGAGAGGASTLRVVIGTGGATPLPTGAATSALQPGFGTAGSPSANVASVQGVAGGTPVPVTDPPYAAVTQIGSMQKGVSTTSAVGMTVPANTVFCVIQPQIANLNYETDGSNPAAGATGGLQLNLGGFLTVSASVGSTIKIINQLASSGAVFTAECYK